MTTFYNTLSSAVYNCDKAIGTSFGDVEFYLNRLAGIPGKILEPAVGNGRLLIPLTETGFTVDGFDLSEAMLRHCRQNCHDRGLSPHLWQDSMTTFTSNERYEAIILPAGSFLLLPTHADGMEALRRFHRHLVPGGRLLMDLFLPDELMPGQESFRRFPVNNRETITLTSTVRSVDFVRQSVASYNRYEKWVDGKLTETELERFPVRWIGIEEAKLMLKEAGFTDIRLFVDYQMDKQPEQAGEMLTFEAVAK